jgi:hypothetical protein
MENVIVLIDFSRNNYTDGELVSETELYIECMTGNPNYLTPSPTLIVVQGALTSFSGLRLAAQTGRIGTTEAKNEGRTILEGILKSLGLYVQLNCGNSKSKALSSGYSIKKASSKVGQLSKPIYFLIENMDNSGDALMHTPVIPHADKYQWETSQDPPGVARVVTTTVTGPRELMLTGLTVGGALYGRVAGVGTDPTLVWSNWFMLNIVT